MAARRTPTPTQLVALGWDPTFQALRAVERAIYTAWDMSHDKMEYHAAMEAAYDRALADVKAYADANWPIDN